MASWDCYLVGLAVAGLVVVDDGIVEVGGGAEGLLLALVVEAAFLGEAVVVVPLDAPLLGEAVVLEVEAGEGHHAMHGEAVIAVKAQLGVGGVEPVAAKAWLALILAGVELAQVEIVPEMNVTAQVPLADLGHSAHVGHQVDLELVGILACWNLVGGYGDFVIEGAHADETGTVGHGIACLIGEFTALRGGENRVGSGLCRITAQYAVPHLQGVGQGADLAIGVDAVASRDQECGGEGDDGSHVARNVYR